MRGLVSKQLQQCGEKLASFQPSKMPGECVPCALLTEGVRGVSNLLVARPDFCIVLFGYATIAPSDARCCEVT